MEREDAAKPAVRADEGDRRGQAVSAPGLSGSRRMLLNILKREGSATIPALAEGAGLNVETVRHHLGALAGQGLVERQGTRRSGPGRPEVVYGLTDDAETLFPRREGEILRGLVEHLLARGHEGLLKEFFDAYIGERREAALARVSHLEGAARAEEAARVLSELGFMALAQEGVESAELRLCHCPLRELVEVTRIPCRAELGFIRELMGEGLTRLSYIPAGDASCTYQHGAA